MAGHSFVNKWLAKMKITLYADCDVCLEEETADHFIIHCNKYGVTRSEYDFDGKYGTLIDLFRTEDTELFKKVCNFLRKIKIEL